MSRFLFDGDFKRKPAQQLGGSSKLNDNREAVLQRAREERQRRENKRAEMSAIATLQAYIRGCLDRIRMHTRFRQEFDSRRGQKISDSDLTRQTLLLNSFFRGSREDTERLMELVKQLLTNVVAVAKFVRTDPLGLLSIKKILRLCISSLEDKKVSSAVFLRMIETFTDPAVYQEEGQNALTDKTVEILANMWLYLVVKGDFFKKYRRFLECRLPPMASEVVENPHLDIDGYLLPYVRVFGLRSELNARDGLKVSVKKEIFDSKKALCRIYKLFINCFVEDVIPLKGNLGIAAYLIIPRLAVAIDWAYWCYEVVQFLQSCEDMRRIRQLLYVSLNLFRHLNIADRNDRSFLLLVTRLLSSLDIGYETQQLIDICQEEFESKDVVPVGEYQLIEAVYLQQMRIVYSDLIGILNTMDVKGWVCPFDKETWSQFCFLCSSLICFEPSRVNQDLKFISELGYQSSFMRALCLHFLTDETFHPFPGATEDGVLVFCYLFDAMSTVLHDVEFINKLPIRLDELRRIILKLRDAFVERILKDITKEGHPSLFIFTKKAVAITLMRIHDRNVRLNLFPEDIFISSTLSQICPVETHSLTFGNFSLEFPANLGPLDSKLLRILADFPFALSFIDRVKAWNRLLDLDKDIRVPNPMAHVLREEIQIRRSYLYEDAFEKLSPVNVPDIRRHIRISLVNVVGVMEAGIDGGGLLREFLTEVTKEGVNPNRGLFRFDSQNRMYPNPVAKRLLSDTFRNHFFIIGRLVGKALYEQTLLELPMAAFFIQFCIEGQITSAADFLATLDPELHNNLLGLKSVDENVLNTLGLDFTLTVEELGETRVVELKKDGRNISVEKNNVIEYIHLVSQYKINKEMEEECRSFRKGLMDVVPTLRMFSWKELQTLISGSDRPIDVDDWRANTNYGPGFTDDHVSVVLFWNVVKSFDENSLRMLLKFVTSCSRPPLLGFKDLVPKFGLQSAGKTDRLPTAATCMNLLKLPEFETAEQMREKLLYAIRAQAGFELS